MLENLYSLGQSNMRKPFMVAKGFCKQPRTKKLICHINCGVSQRFPALRKAVNAHV